MHPVKRVKCREKSGRPGGVSRRASGHFSPVHFPRYELYAVLRRQNGITSQRDTIYEPFQNQYLNHSIITMYRCPLEILASANRLSRFFESSFKSSYRRTSLSREDRTRAFPLGKIPIVPRGTEYYHSGRPAVKNKGKECEPLGAL